MAYTLAGVTTASGVIGVAFSPDGGHLLTGDDRITATTVWDVGPGGDAEVANLPGNPNTWIHPAYTGDGHLAIPTGGGAVTVWDTSTATQQARLTYPNPSAVAADWADDIASIAISPDGTLLAAGDGNPARAWDLTTGDELFSKSPGGWISQPAFSPDSELLALAGDSGTLSLYDREGTLRAQLRAEDGSGLQDPTFSPDGSNAYNPPQLPALSNSSAARPVTPSPVRAPRSSPHPAGSSARR
jgi:WD40 repeat protein